MKVPYSSRVLVSVLVTALLSACGSSGITGVPNTAAQNDNTSSTPGQVIISPSGDYAAYPYSFSTYGSAPTTVTTALHTDTKLIVKVNAEAAGVINAPGTPSNFAAEYHCVQFNVTLQVNVNGTWTTLGSQNTSSLNVAGTAGCTGGVASQSIDFSAYMTPGHGDVRVQVTSLKTDFYCILYNKCLADAQTYYSYACYFARQPNAALYACPVKTIYASHNVNGSLEVQVNGTSFVKP